MSDIRDDFRRIKDSRIRRQINWCIAVGAALLALGVGLLARAA